MKLIRSSVAVALALGIALATTAAQSTSLRIVVIAGEGGVNIIQQKSAVAPVVEVRDANNQPVAGATVRFSIQGGRATFSGARTLNVTTDVAGRATGGGLTPTAAGAVQIGTSATFQGVTATATIVQTNFVTAAAATAGTAAGGGGILGLSATTLGIVGGAAVGGTLLAKQVLSGSTYKGPFSFQTLESSFFTQSSGAKTGACTSTLLIEGTMTAQFAEEGDGPIQGELLREWGTTEIARTCPGAKGAIPGDHRGSDFTGTASNLQLTDGYGNSYTSFTFTFSGAISGNTLTGTYTMNYNNVGPPDQNGLFWSASYSGSTQVTLTKQ